MFIWTLEIWFKVVQDLLQNDFFLGVENIPKEKMFFLNLNFLPDSFFGMLDDPYMHAAEMDVWAMEHSIYISICLHQLLDSMEVWCQPIAPTTTFIHRLTVTDQRNPW